MYWRACNIETYTSNFSYWQTTASTVRTVWYILKVELLTERQNEYIHVPCICCETTCMMSCCSVLHGAGAAATCPGKQSPTGVVPSMTTRERVSIHRAKTSWFWRSFPFLNLPQVGAKSDISAVVKVRYVGVFSVPSTDVVSGRLWRGMTPVVSNLKFMTSASHVNDRCFNVLTALPAIAINILRLYL